MGHGIPLAFLVIFDKMEASTKILHFIIRTHGRSTQLISVDSRNFKKWGRSPTTTKNVGERLKLLGDIFIQTFLTVDFY